MSQLLFKLKEFLTLEEAGEHLSRTLSEKVSLADIYRLALDGHITISVNFLGFIPMSPGRIVKDDSESPSPYITIKKSLSMGEELKEPYILSKTAGFPISISEWLFFDREIMYTYGDWELSMLGHEYDYIEELYHQEIGGGGTGRVFSGRIKAIVLTKLGSYFKIKDLPRPPDLGENELAAFIDDASNSVFFDTLTLDSYRHQLIIKTAEITRFLQSLQGGMHEQESSVLSTKERNTLLAIIAALLQEQGINPSERGVTAAVRLMTEKTGFTVSENTIRNVLKQVSGMVS
ncbi:hypothetical protein [Escherichia coli]|uniref:hypothetical protein n=1 Tax=Escherichia coli TaxID=562 RepID=UPI002F964532